MNNQTHEALFEEYKDGRTLDKLQKYALWTISSAFPDTGNQRNLQGDISVEHDYQSIGAILVNYLAAKLAGLLFPVTQSFFKIQPTPVLLSLASQQFGVEAKEVQNRLIKLENEACAALYKNASYAQLVQMLRYLIITGNAMFKRIDGRLTVYSLRNYSQLRDNEGNLLDAILRESWAYNSLPESVRPLANLPVGADEFAPIDVYTRIKRVHKTDKIVYEVSQEIGGKSLGKASEYPEHLCPYQTVVWNIINGDSNGRGLVEDHAGDFAKLSDLSRALAVYEINSCRVVNLVKPGATVDIEALNTAYCGEFVQGDPGNINALESGDAQKIQQLASEIQAIFQRLAMAFMYQGNTRDAERVTAEELRLNAQEAENALGGQYSQLSQGIHLPLSHLLCMEVSPNFITALVAGELTLDVITGLPALGRSTVVTQLLQAIQELSLIIPAMKQLSPRFDTEAVIDTVLQARGVNLDDTMFSAEELQAQQDEMQAQQAQQQAMMGGGASPEVAQTIQGII